MATRFVIPIGGEGTRTRELGEYKPFIMVNDYSIIQYSILGFKHLLKPEDSIGFIFTDEQDKKYDVRNILKTMCKHINVSNQLIFSIIDSTQGQLETIYKGIYLNPDSYPKNSDRLVIVNSDQFNYFKIPEQVFDMALGCYFENQGKSAYLSIKGSQYVSQIVEKITISGYASSGVFVFKSVEYFDSLFEHISNLKTFRESGEVYLSHLINFVLSNKQPQPVVVPFTSSIKIDLGNVDQILSIKNYNVLDIHSLAKVVK